MSEQNEDHSKLNKNNKTKINGIKTEKNESTNINMLLSEERLDRSSPELWPETIPGVTEFLARSQSPYSPNSDRANSLPEWLQEYNEDDINMLHGYGSLTAMALLEKVKELQDLAYQLGLEEEREMTRAKFLNVLSNQINREDN